jgi:hypothetical protein
MMQSDEKSSNSPDEDNETRDLDSLRRTGHNGVTLLPYPSDDPQDPLVSLSLILRRQMYLICELSITELAYEEKTQDPGGNLSCYLLRLFCVFGWTITSRTSVNLVQSYNHTDGLSSRIPRVDYRDPI